MKKEMKPIYMGQQEGESTRKSTFCVEGQHHIAYYREHHLLLHKNGERGSEVLEYTF